MIVRSRPDLLLIVNLPQATFPGCPLYHLASVSNQTLVLPKSWSTRPPPGRREPLLPSCDQSASTTLLSPLRSKQPLAPPPFVEVLLSNRRYGFSFKSNWRDVFIP